MLQSRTPANAMRNFVGFLFLLKTCFAVIPFDQFIIDTILKPIFDQELSLENFELLILKNEPIDQLFPNSSKRLQECKVSLNFSTLWELLGDTRILFEKSSDLCNDVPNYDLDLPSVCATIIKIAKRIANSPDQTLALHS